MKAGRLKVKDLVVVGEGLDPERHVMVRVKDREAVYHVECIEERDGTLYFVADPTEEQTT